LNCQKRQQEAIRGSTRVAVVADGLDRAAFHGFLAARLLFGGRGLLFDVGIAAVVIAGEIVRRRLASQVAVNALVVHVKLAGGVFSVAVCNISHKFSAMRPQTMRSPAPHIKPVIFPACSKDAS